MSVGREMKCVCGEGNVSVGREMCLWGRGAVGGTAGIAEASPWEAVSL